MALAAAPLRPVDGGSQPGARLLLVVDQLEELFSLDTIAPDDRSRFASLIQSLACDPLSRTWVIATLRSDFYAPFAATPEFAELKEGTGHYDLSPPTPTEIGQLIREPAAAGACRFEQAAGGEQLDDVLRDEAVKDPSVLPLLEFLLSELYECRTDKGRLTFEAYHKLGGVTGALARRAEATFAELPSEVQGDLPAVFRQMVTLGTLSDETPTRKAVPLASFRDARLQFVRAFVDSRLFVSDHDDRGMAIVRLSHESLLSRWERLRAWLAADKELLLVKARVEASTARWVHEGRPADLLLPAGQPLQEAEQLTAAGFELEPATRELIDASRSRAIRNRLIRQSAVAALAVLAVGMSAFAALALVQYYKAAELARQKGNLAQANGQLADEKSKLADTNGRLALEKGKLADSNGKLALEKGELAERAQRLADERQRLLDAERTQRTRLEWQLHARNVERIRRFAQEGNGAEARTLLFAVPPDKQGWETAYLANMLFGQHNTLRTTATVNRVCFTPDGRHLVADSELSVLVWDTLTGRDVWRFRFPKPAVRTPLGSHDGIAGLACSADGKYVIAVTNDERVAVLDAATGKPIRQFGAGKGSPVQCAALSPEGTILAVGLKDGELRLSDLSTGEPMGEIDFLNNGKTKLNCLAFSADGKMLAAGYETGIGRVWDVRTRAAVALFGGDGRPPINGLAWGPADAFLLGACDSGLLKKWDTAGKEVESRFIHNGNALTAVTFVADGSLYATAARDGLVSLWQTTTDRVVKSTIPGGGQVEHLVFSPFGRRLAIPGDSGVQVWDWLAGDRLGSVTQSVTALDFSRDGKKVVVVSDADLTVLDRADFSRLFHVRMPDYQPRDAMTKVAFTPDADRIVVGHVGGAVSVFVAAVGQVVVRDRTTGTEVASFSSGDQRPAAGTFGADGKTVTVVSESGFARVWDLATRQPVREFQVTGGQVKTVRYTAGDQRLVLGSGRDERYGRVRIADPYTGQALFDHELRSVLSQWAARSRRRLDLRRKPRRFSPSSGAEPGRADGALDAPVDRGQSADGRPRGGSRRRSRRRCRRTPRSTGLDPGFGRPPGLRPKRVGLRPGTQSRRRAARRWHLGRPHTARRRRFRVRSPGVGSGGWSDRRAGVLARRPAPGGRVPARPIHQGVDRRRRAVGGGRGRPAVPGAQTRP